MHQQSVVSCAEIAEMNMLSLPCVATGCAELCWYASKPNVVCCFLLQVSDQELEAIARGEGGAGMDVDTEGAGGDATRRLLGDYQTPARYSTATLVQRLLDVSLYTLCVQTAVTYSLLDTLHVRELCRQFSCVDISPVAF